MKQTDHNNVYEQGIANLKLEGMHWTPEQDQMAREYLAGEIGKKELIQKALEYARSFNTIEKGVLSNEEKRKTVKEPQ
tara:strand:- start:834 stop:1067 length:234 start_codon:yes stop_codon:yes gene_type:complete